MYGPGRSETTSEARTCSILLASSTTNQAAEPHVPDIRTAEGVLDVMALGNLLIFMRALSLSGDEASLDVKLGVAAYAQLLKIIDERFALETLHGSPHTITAARVLFRYSAQYFAQGILYYHKTIISQPHLCLQIPSSHQLQHSKLQQNLSQAYHALFEESLDDDGHDGSALLCNPQFTVRAWKGILGLRFILHSHLISTQTYHEICLYSRVECVQQKHRSLCPYHQPHPILSTLAIKPVPPCHVVLCHIHLAIPILGLHLKANPPLGK